MYRIILGALCLVLLSGCGIEQETKDTKNLVKDSNVIQRDILDGIERTLAATNQMKALIALQNMTSDENTVFLSPPTMMMPYAQAFTLEATEEQIVHAAYLFLNTALMPLPEAATPEQTRMKAVCFAAFSAMAGLMPDKTLASILKNQINGGGRYIDVAGALAASRYQFIRDVLLVPLLERSKQLTAGSLEEAVQKFRSLKFLVTLPYAAKLGFSVNKPTGEAKVVIIDSLDRLKLLGEKAIDTFKEGLATGTYSSHTALLEEFVVQ